MNLPHVFTQITPYIPGILLVLIFSFCAITFAQFIGTSPMMIGLLMGIGCSMLSRAPSLKAGINWVSISVLQISIALLGLRVSFKELSTLGWDVFSMLVLSIFTTIMLGIYLARFFGIDKKIGALTGAATSICGASAAIAVSAVLPDDKDKGQNTILAIIVVTALSSIAMIVYPFIADTLHLNTEEAGLFFGGSIHNVPHVVGAGYTISEETGDLAALTKLVRISLLMPVILCFLFVFKTGDTETAKKKCFPKFLTAFFVLVLINQIITIPDMIKTPIHDLTKFGLLAAIIAIGLKSDPKEMLRPGRKMFVLMTIETIWLALFVLFYILYLSKAHLF